jgi:uncharacterized membrane protein YfcA
VGSLELFIMLGGVAAGLVGALMGIGGGVFLVPLLNSVAGLGFSEATAISLVTVLGTSASAVMTPPDKKLLNLRLAILLLLFSVTGATAGALTFDLLSTRTKQLIFGVTAAAIGGILFVRSGRRNIMPPAGAGIGVLGGSLYDDDTKQVKSYRVKRLPVAAGVSLAAGTLASYIGIGGGILIVPTLNSLCGVPLRVAAATSVLMIGVTAVPGVVAHWAKGFLGDYHLAAIATIGSLIGFRIGLYIGPRAPVQRLKALLVAILGIVAVKYLLFGG